jgi:hypothetical protein
VLATAGRLAEALRRFEAHQGPLTPHVASGALTKDQYRRAHLRHLANQAEQLTS